jgi:hypothetical protein
MPTIRASVVVVLMVLQTEVRRRGGVHWHWHWQLPLRPRKIHVILPAGLDRRRSFTLPQEDASSSCPALLLQWRTRAHTHKSVNAKLGGHVMMYCKQESTTPWEPQKRGTNTHIKVIKKEAD